METIANYFSDEAIILIMGILAILLCVAAFLPVYLSEKALKRYNETFEKASIKEKKKIGTFINKPKPFVSTMIAILAVLSIFFCYIKYLKDVNNKTLLTEANIKSSRAYSLIENINKQLADKGYKVTKDGKIIIAGMYFDGDYGTITGGTFIGQTINEPKNDNPNLVLLPEKEIVLIDSTVNKYTFQISYFSEDAGSENFKINTYVAYKTPQDKLMFFSKGPMPTSDQRISKGYPFNIKFHLPYEFKAVYVFLDGTYTNMDNNKNFTINDVYEFQSNSKPKTILFGQQKREIVNFIYSKRH